MSILIVSENPLFKEVIREVIFPVQTDTIELLCEEALTRIGELRPAMMIIDETIPQLCFEGILAEARKIQKIRVMVLNPIQNEILLIDSRRMVLRTVEDIRGDFQLYSDMDAGDNDTDQPDCPEDDFLGTTTWDGIRNKR